MQSITDITYPCRHSTKFYSRILHLTCVMRLMAHWTVTFEESIKSITVLYD